MKKIAWILVALALMSARVAQAETRWIRVRTDHFMFVGDASESQIRDVALHLEQFRDVLSRVLPRSAVVSVIPTIVYVFQNDSSLTPYKPTFQGRPIALAGFFAGAPDRNLMAISAGAQQSALRVVFHEYAHFLVQNTAGRLPPWANEGLAGFYEMFQERAGGKSALIGVLNEEHVNLLRNVTLTPLRDLLAIDYGSPEYNEGNRRGVFYAESWALMHYLQLGNPSRARQLSDYLVRLHGGAEPNEAFTAVFGDTAVLERELRDYVRKFTFPVVRFDFSEKVGGSAAGAADRLNDVDVATYLGDLLARTGHLDEARSRLRKVLEANPDSSGAAEVLGVLELNAGNGAAALPWLERASHNETDAAAQIRWGRALIEKYEEASLGDPQRPSTINDARAVLARAAALRPDDAEALAIFGRAESIAGEDVAKALSLLDRAVALAPGQEEYRLMLAEELARQRQFERATTLLGPLVASAKRPEIREAARQMLSNVATRVTASNANSLPPPPRDSSSASGGRFVPVFRTLRAEETRTVGMFTAVDCQRGSIVLHVDTEDESLRLAAADFKAIEFISYQSTTPKPVGCGPVDPPARVFATYRESESAMQATGIDGRVVAIEVLPDGYVVR